MNWHLLLALALSMLVPGALIATGLELRRVRLRVVMDLHHTVFIDDQDLPQLVLARARYDSHSDDDKAGGRQGEVKQVLGAAIYALISLLGFTLLLDPIAYLIGAASHSLVVTEALLWMPTIRAADAPALRIAAQQHSAAIAGFAFLGAYVFNMSYLIRCTLNQELSALAFVRAALRLLLGMIVAIVFYQVGAGAALGDAASKPGAAGFAAALAIAFVLGYFPDVGIGRIAKWARIHIKTVDEEVLQRAKLIPLEIIDGIDHEIAFRLQESNLYDIQNLAVANPIELYAETPYSLLEVFDWVLQAQLCLVVGTKAFDALKNHRIRTIFDLERAALARGVPEDYLRALASVILSDASPCFRKTLGLSDSYEVCAEMVTTDVVVIRHIVAIICDDLHVHRLRALWQAIMRTTSGQKHGKDAPDGQANKPLWLFDVGWLPGDGPPPAAN